MNFGSKLFPLECTQAKKLTDGRLVRLGRPHVRRTTDITVSQKLTLSKLRWAKNVCGVMVLVYCTSSDNALYLYQILWKYLKGFGSYCADTISIVKFAKGHNSIKNVGGVMVLVLCMSCNDALYLYRGSWKYLKGFQSYWADTISMVKFSKGHNSVKNVGGVKVLILCASSDDALYL